ncbi:MAG TPA: glutamine--fructose-6-phosphate transaminase (isomerizing) [Candidatus Paceibacterota bacterium]|nr:glutamine--fructose-6-phosphate transaminase (isomerizing) [Candidatus Paceibacterota bacterium]
MCGIVGYVGEKKALPILIEGLKALEYRGYDSAGVSIITDGEIKTYKKAGPVAELEKVLAANGDVPGNIGIAHTRWATHGAPNDINAHPHSDCTGRVSLIHNGIVENHRELKGYLAARGHRFVSETDTEVVAHLIEDFLRSGAGFRDAFFSALKTIEGSYSFVILDRDDPGRFYAARASSPLVVGIGKGENFIASDPSALVGSTREVIFLKDGEAAEITPEEVAIRNLDQEPTPLEIERLEWSLEQAQKGNFPHFMLKEIFEGPEVLRQALSGRLKPGVSTIKLGGLESVDEKLKGAKRFIILACGTSYYAGMVGEYIFEEIAGIPTEVHFASEFRYREEPFDPGTVALVVSQSGETADTLAALRKAKNKGLLTLGVVNVVGSSIARETDAGVYNHAGPEIGVASTKAFISQIATLALIAMHLAEGRNSVRRELMEELTAIPEKIDVILQRANDVEKLAEKYKNYANFLFLGRRYNYPVALEGALKLKEISYVHAEGYGAGEMKHGPIAMISPDFPTVAVVPKNSVSEKMYSNIQEIRARRGPVIAVATEGDKEIASLADDIFYIPETLEPLEPLISVVPLQLFAYYVGVKKGYNVDKPRNLAKSVTVE